MSRLACGACVALTMYLSMTSNPSSSRDATVGDIVGASVFRQQEGRQDAAILRTLVVGDRELVVVRGAPVDPSIIDGIRHPLLGKDTEALHEFRIELRSADATVSLWSHLKAGDYDVLDLTLEAGHITVASAEGGQLFISRIGVGYGMTESVTLRGADWSAIARPWPFDRRHVEVKLGRLEDGRATVNVVDRRGETTPQRTVFKQAKERWTFDLVERSGGPPGTPQLEQ